MGQLGVLSNSLSEEATAQKRPSVWKPLYVALYDSLFTLAWGMGRQKKMRKDSCIYLLYTEHLLCFRHLVDA